MLTINKTIFKNVHQKQKVLYLVQSSYQRLLQDAVKTSSTTDWNRAVTEAERIVGYPTSFLSLRWLLSDEIANVALHLRKLVGSTHPILKTAKNLLYTGKNPLHTWGLIILLVSKAVGHSSQIPEIEQDKSAGVLHAQRGLAEVTEMIRIAHLVHSSLVNLQRDTELRQQTDLYDDMSFGNKISLLTGDYLLGHSSAELSNLRNQEVVELISSAVRDFSESEFVGERDEQNNPLPSKPGTPFSNTKRIDTDENDITMPFNVYKAMGTPAKEWEVRNTLSSGSLLGKSCQAALKLAGLNTYMQHQAFLFGKHLALAWQACLDLAPFRAKDFDDETSFSLVSAPVLFHLDFDITLYNEIEKGKKSVANINYDKIYQAIKSGPALEKTEELQRMHISAAIKVLHNFPESETRTTLEQIVLKMQDM